jgi:putative aldouronate transport system permease protein
MSDVSNPQISEPIADAVGKKTAGLQWSKMKRYKYLYLLLVPAIVYFVVFKYAPMYGIIIAFKDYRFGSGILGSKWNGFEHFATMFGRNSFWQVFRNTIVISIAKLFIGFPAPVIFAILLNEIRNIKFKKVSQTISYLPHFLSWVVVAGIIREFLSARGPINALVTALGGESTVFLAEVKLFVPILVITAVWKNIGWGSIVYLASISSIDPQLYEAAEIDGASRLRRIFHITLPSLIPVISILFLLRIGHIMNAGFDQIFNLYSPIVYSVGDIIDTYTYRVGLLQMDFSYAAAVGIFKNVLGLVLILVVNLTVNRVKEYGIW